MYAITHIVNPVKVSPSSDLYKAQPITFESLLRAKQFTKASHPDIQINLCTTQFPEDHTVIPNYLFKLPNLNRSVIDIFGKACKKKLPLICDILDSVKSQAFNSDFLIYSNVDIAVQPYFYNAIITLIQNGYDAIAVNRRTISEALSDINLMYAAKGAYHVGVDCFVFSKTILHQFYLENGFIGSGPVGMFFCINMAAHANKFIWIENEHFTFHLGDDKVWLKTSSFHNLRIFNYKELIKVCDFYLQNRHSKNDIRHFSQTLKDFCLFHQLSPKQKENLKRPDHRAALRVLSQPVSGLT